MNIYDEHLVILRFLGMRLSMKVFLSTTKSLGGVTVILITLKCSTL